ncbi:hypothetical protein [Amycolatopsis alkalitolerans]|uniref:Uncharacterized protein n=1 Tax=Amycolatopsis alkalitolerans TaxID=2547244 RepID=A0A5C4LPL5_9PSEU|nr:hypothetical protein [Amycolatopsis alkalitolerans]TNC19624.1 hypothetical protein FG385_32190 [Amycolatopsis alkalitolerans]
MSIMGNGVWGLVGLLGLLGLFGLRRPRRARAEDDPFARYPVMSRPPEPHPRPEVPGPRHAAERREFASPAVAPAGPLERVRSWFDRRRP